MTDLTEFASRHPVLTLRNIYRLLTRQDYPSFSYRVIPESGLRGVTLSKFWGFYFRSAFPDSIDVSFLDQSESRSRNLSRLMNRSGSPRLMEEWFNSLSGLLGPELLLSMTETWIGWLERKHYDPKALEMKLGAFSRAMLEAQDLGSAEATARFCREMLPPEQAPSGTGTVPQLFLQGAALSWLTLYALYGTRLQDTALTRLRVRGDSSPAALYQLYRGQKAPVQPAVISSRQSVLCVQPLAEKMYHGYREELDRAEAVFTDGGGKLIVLGIGGIGKTEFVRQLLPRLIRRNLYRRLAFAQYENGLANTMAAAFPALRDSGADRCIAQARTLLEDPEKGRTLLLIDNVDLMPSGDPDLESLSTYGCDIILTSRFFETKGFETLRLSGLDPDSALSLFGQYYQQRSDVRETAGLICASAAYHPLAVILFASLCRSRFWPPEKLLERLNAYGLSSLSYIRQASPVNLADIFSELFDLSVLSRAQAGVMKLLSLLPYRFWLPDELFPYARDICGSREELTDLCCVLHDLAWLLTSDNGFAVHPLIAETVRLLPTDADDYPLLWAYLETEAGGRNDLANRALISLILHTGRLNLPAVRCLAKLEQSVGAISYISLPEALYDRHEQFLNSQAHEPEDEADYLLGRGFRDIVLFSRRDRLPDYLEKIMALPGGTSRIRDRACAYTVLEYACSCSGRQALAERFFDALRPADPESREMAEHLISFSILQRQGSHDPEAALRSLREAGRLLENLGQQESMNQANLDYRQAVCLLDLGRAGEARPLLENCLRLLRKNGLSETAPKILSTRNTYAVSLMISEDRSKALEEYESLASVYREQGRKYTSEYAALRNNTAVLLDGMGKQAEARAAVLEALEVDARLSAVPEILATHCRNAALILAHAREDEAAEPYAQKASDLRNEIFGASSPWTADAEAVRALVLFHLGEKEKAEALIASALGQLERQWGAAHRHTVNAQAIKKEMETA